MSYSRFKAQSHRARVLLGFRLQRISHWKVLVMLCLILILIFGFLLRKYTKGEGDDYDYFYFAHESLELFGENESSERIVRKNPVMIKTKPYDGREPIIFISGYEQSGTKVVEEVIERYVKISCNNDTGVLAQALRLFRKWTLSSKEMTRLEEANINKELLLELFEVFARQIIFGQHQAKKSQEIICVQEDDIFNYAGLLSRMFPIAKFIFVVRDGRPVVNAIVNDAIRKGEEAPPYYNEFLQWSNSMDDLLRMCDNLGPESCYIVRYEDLFISPWETLDSVLYFLEQISILPVADDRSKPLVANSSAAFEYLANRRPIPQEVLNEAASFASTFEKLGYDPKLYVAGNSAQDFET